MRCQLPVHSIAKHVPTDLPFNILPVVLKLPKMLLNMFLVLFDGNKLHQLPVWQLLVPQPVPYHLPCQIL